MGQVNGMRVMVNVLGIAALGWSVCCPWWVCRWETDEELPARMEQWKSFPEIAAFVAETEVKMVPLWRIEDYGKREWMTFNIIQWGAVVGLWTLGLQFARDFDAPQKMSDEEFLEALKRIETEPPLGSISYPSRQ